jgi:SAM-dependent methyltransferase
MSSGIIEHHWLAWDTMLRYVEQIAGTIGLVVEIGPGSHPFAPAHEFVDWGLDDATKGKTLHILDINSESLPFADKSVDFIYCRHTLEDIHDPFWACQEMSRVAKAGYIETPSPLAELCRGVDGGRMRWRGYHHHRYFAWNDNGVLTFLPKYPIIEYILFADLEHEIVTRLNEGPLHWNTYYFWNDAVRLRSLCHERDFLVTETYSHFIVEGVTRTLEHHARIKSSEDYRSA